MKKVSVLFLFVLILGCAKEQINTNQPFIQPENGLEIDHIDGEIRDNLVYDDSFETHLVDIKNNTITFYNSVAKAEEIKVGSVLVLDSREELPGGLIFKVLERKDEGDLIILTTEEGNLEDVFKNLDFKITQHTYEEKPITRGIKFEKDVLDVVTLEFVGTPQTMTMTPTFARNGSFTFDVDVDFENFIVNHINVGIENYSILAELLIQFQGNIEGNASLKEADDFAIPLPDIKFKVYGVPITITNRIVPSPELTAKLKGQLDIVLKSEMTQPFNAYFEINPSKYPTETYKFICTDNVCTAPDFDFDMDVTNIDGEATLDFDMFWNIESAIAGQYDYLKTVLGFGIPHVTFGASVDVVNEETIATISGETAVPINIEIISEALFKSFNLTNFENPVKKEFEPFKSELFSKQYKLPCSITYTGAKTPTASCLGGNSEEVSLTFKLNASNGSDLGYRVIVDGFQIGTFAYGPSHTVTIPSNKMKPASEIQLVDAETPGCRFKYNLFNPCEQIIYCEDNPIFDTDGSEYCIQTMADGRIWTNTNLHVSGGVCHHNNPSSCFELGSYYEHTTAILSGLCPSGFRLPSSQEWITLLEAESRINSGSKKVPHLLAQNLSDGWATTSTSETNGFNIIPTGQYQSWKTNLPVNERFTGGIFDNLAPGGIFAEQYQAYFWTSDELDYPSQVPGGGAYAMRIFPNGNWSLVTAPRKTGLACRCIKN